MQTRTMAWRIFNGSVISLIAFSIYIFILLKEIYLGAFEIVALASLYTWIFKRYTSCNEKNESNNV